MIEIKNILNDKENELLRNELIKAFPNEFELKENEYFYKNKKGEWCIWKNPDTNAKVVAIWKPEKTADELFEELGYRILEQVNEQVDKYGCGIQFKKEMAVTTKYIEFYYYHKQICIYEDQYIDDKIIRHDSCLLTPQELQAINKKVEELRMELITIIAIWNLIKVSKEM